MTKHRVESARLPGWDYTSPGYYFVTICTKDREPFFGKIVAEEWQRAEQIRQNVDLDEWVIMPNHLHGFVIINETHNEG